MTTGQNIRALRKKRGLTQEKLGELCGMTAGAISSYENGVTVPKRRVVERIARALNVPAGKIADSAPPEIAPQTSSWLPPRPPPKPPRRGRTSSGVRPAKPAQAAATDWAQFQPSL